MIKFLSAIIGMLMLSVSIAQRTVIHCGQLVDVKNLQLLKEMTIITEGNKIVDVQKGYTAGAAGDKLIDLKSKTVMPGLIDMHVHMERSNIVLWPNIHRESEMSLLIDSSHAGYWAQLGIGLHVHMDM